MNKNFLLILFLLPYLGYSQSIINSWTLNVAGKKASYYKTTQSGMSVTYTFTNTTDSADVLAVCYDASYVYVKSKGMTDYMGKYLNPGISRMKTGYSLRNITTRTTIPTYSSASPAVTTYTTASQTGPSVNATYPIGSYCEDYEWLSSNGGDLDQYNGRYCVTPEYPSGTYAYFVTVTAAGVAAFPYYIGLQYYGTPATANFSNSGTANTVVIGTSVACNYPGTLPLELLAFEGINEKNKNKLTWQTASEINVSHFSIERSKDGLNFEEIGKILAKGTPNSLETYTFMDDSPFSRNYYRLKMVDNDGTSDLSKTIALINSQLNAVLIFPSIAKDVINIRSQNNLNNATIKINDLMGRTLIYFTMDLGKNEQKELNIAALAKGFYFVSVEANGLKSINKIIKE